MGLEHLKSKVLILKANMQVIDGEGSAVLCVEDGEVERK